MASWSALLHGPSIETSIGLSEQSQAKDTGKVNGEPVWNP